MSFPAYPEYKESGVEWLGTVPAAWRVVRTFHLGVCIRTGKVDVNIQEEDGIYPFFTCSKDAKKASQFSFDCEALLVAGNGEVGYTQYYKGKFEAYQRTYVLSDFGDMNARFLQYHYMENLVVSVKGKSIGSVIQFITLNDLRDFPVPIPSQSEQTQIARFLDHETARIDALIEEQQRLIELLREKRQAVISHAVTKGLDPTVPMKDSGVDWLGEVPGHWDVKALRRVIKNSLSNGVFKKKEDFGRGVLLVNVFDVYRQDFQVNYSTLDRVDCTEAEASSFSVMPGDLFFVRSSLKYEGIAVVAVAGDCLEPVVYECHLIRARPDPDFLNGRYGSYLFNSNTYRAILTSKAKLTTMTTIDQEAISSTLITVPPLSEQTSISTYLDRETDKIDRLIGEADAVRQLLKERRSALISAAVTGKIDVRGWQPPASAPTPELVQEAV